MQFINYNISENKKKTTQLPEEKMTGTGTPKDHDAEHSEIYENTKILKLKTGISGKLEFFLIFLILFLALYNLINEKYLSLKKSNIFNPEIQNRKSNSSFAVKFKATQSVNKNTADNSKKIKPEKCIVKILGAKKNIPGIIAVVNGKPAAYFSVDAMLSVKSLEGIVDADGNKLHVAKMQISSSGIIRIILKDFQNSNLKFPEFAEKCGFNEEIFIYSEKGKAKSLNISGIGTKNIAVFTELYNNDLGEPLLNSDNQLIGFVGYGNPQLKIQHGNPSEIFKFVPAHLICQRIRKFDQWNDISFGELNKFSRIIQESNSFMNGFCQVASRWWAYPYKTIPKYIAKNSPREIEKWIEDHNKLAEKAYPRGIFRIRNDIESFSQKIIDLQKFQKKICDRLTAFPKNSSKQLKSHIFSSEYIKSKGNNYALIFDKILNFLEARLKTVETSNPISFDYIPNGKY